MLDLIKHHLAGLVAIDTTNPPRAITADGPLVQLLTQALVGFDISVTDYGNGSIVFEAIRGTPDVLFNVHLDTVPIAPGWTRTPHEMGEDADKLYGLGVCDIKGAAAILIALAQTTDLPMHLVFSTDEEAGQSTCIQTYLKTPPRVKQVVVAEPTQGKAILAHRGIFSARVDFTGESTHSSTATPNSATHKAVNWAQRVLSLDVARENRLNIGKISGGIKPNMIANSAEILFGFRMLPGVAHDDILDDIKAATADIGHEIHIRFQGPALPAGSDAVMLAAQEQAKIWCSQNDIEIGEPVNFFTEAAFFNRAGLPVVVLGPGDIAQAHSADEWVRKSCILDMAAIYKRVLARAV